LQLHYFNTLFHKFGSEEVLEEPLDVTGPFEEKKTKRSVFRIKPLAMEGHVHKEKEEFRRIATC
jgi:hypothetical protein